MIKQKIKHHINHINIFFIFTYLFILLASCSNGIVNNSSEINDNFDFFNNERIREPKVVINDGTTQKKNVDILMLMYMDGDNNLHDAIWEDLIETVRGYDQLKDTDNVEVVILWDGWEKASKIRWKSNEWNSASKLFKVSKDFTLIDMSNNISWLNNPMLSLKHTEVNMNERNTLENFLTWAKDNYEAKTKILQLSDHGIGPGEYGYGEKKINRAICQDVGNRMSSYYLGTQDIPKAISNTKIGKIDLIIQDVCLAGAIEEVYEYNGVADYILFSPNLTPNKGHDYVHLISSLSKDKTSVNGKFDVEKFMNLVMQNFIKTYKLPKESWISLKNEFRKSHGLNEISDYDLSLIPLTITSSKDIYKYAINYSNVSTLSAIKITNLDEFKNKLNELIDLINTSDKKVTLHNVVKNSSEEINFKLALQINFDIIDSYTSGSWHTFDIGMFADSLVKLSNGSWPELEKKALELKKVLDNIIVASWRDGANGPLYYKSSMFESEMKPIIPKENGSYGLAIAGYDYVTSDSNYLSGKKNHYSTSLKFANDTNWVSLMKAVKDEKLNKK